MEDLFPPHRFHSDIGRFAYEAIDIRETIMAIASALGGPSMLPSPLDALWEPLGVGEWEIERLRELGSWKTGGHGIDLAAERMVPSIWPPCQRLTPHQQLDGRAGAFPAVW